MSVKQRYFTAQDVATALGAFSPKGASVVKRYSRRGILPPAYRLGQVWLFRRDEVERSLMDYWARDGRAFRQSPLARGLIPEAAPGPAAWPNLYIDDDD